MKTNTQDEQDEFSRAFDEPATEEGGEAVDLAMEAENAGLEGEQNTPDSGAAEGAAGEPDGAAVAVVLNDGAEEGANPETDSKPINYEQKYKTLQGKYNAEVSRLKAMLAAQEQSAPGGEPTEAPAMMDKGGKVDGFDPEGEKWNRIKAEAGREDTGGEPGARRTTPVVTYQDEDFNASGSDYVESDEEADAKTKAFNDGEVVQMAGGGEVEGAEGGENILSQLEEDYGPEFARAIDKLIDQRARAIVSEMGGGFVADVEGKIDALLNESASGLGNLHRSVLLALREDAEEIANSEEFGEWMAGLDDEARAKAEAVVDGGDLPALIALFKQYDGRDGEGEKSPEDVWAEDAAAGVRGSAPIRLPSRAAASAEDEYKSAWDSM